MVLQFTGRGPCLSADCDACPFSDHVLEGRALGAFRCRRCGSCRSYVGRLVAPADPQLLAIAGPVAVLALAIAWDRYEAARIAIDPLYRQKQLAGLRSAFRTTQPLELEAADGAMDPRD